MELPYVEFEGQTAPVYRPCVPVTFSFEGRRFPVGHALVDTGSDFTLLPREVAHILQVELDDTKGVKLGSAGGGSFLALPSRKKIRHTIERNGYRPIRWDGIVYFAAEEPVVLLGHYQCLEYFEITFRGPEKRMSILPCS